MDSDLRHLLTIVSGAALGFALGYAASAPNGESAAPSSPAAPATKEARLRPSPVARPAPAAEPAAEPQACPDFTALCDEQMRAIGCTPPIPFPEDAGRYGAAAVHELVEETLKRCPGFAEEFLHLDCSEYPCLLFLTPAPGATDRSVTSEERAERIEVWPADASCGAFGGNGSPEALFAPTWSGTLHVPQPQTYALHPRLGFPMAMPKEMYPRLHDRVNSYTREEIEAFYAP